MHGRHDRVGSAGDALVQWRLAGIGASIVPPVPAPMAPYGSPMAPK